MEHEMINEYNKRGEKIGVIDKAIAHKEGLLHKAVHVWIINSNNEILIQLRCADKSIYPNTWDCSFAGHIGEGETSIDAVIREGKEEVGIDVDLDKLEYILTHKESVVYEEFISNEFNDVYILRQDIDIKDLVYQVEEVSNAKYISLDEFWELIKTDKIIPHPTEYIALKEILK